jgi:hypothetical protein
VAHTYAGILGPLAFLTSLARGVIHGGGSESLLWGAWCSLLLFAAVGYLIGWVAGQTVEESVRGRISSKLAAEGAAEGPRPDTSGAAGA